MNPRLALVVGIVTIAAPGCRRQPGEPVFVIRAGGSVSIADGHDPDSVIAMRIPDSIAMGDSICLDSVPSPDTLPAYEALEGAGVLAVEIRGSLYATLSSSCPDDDPDVLGAHFTRCLWWGVDPWRGICAGDSILALYRDSGYGLENRTVALKYIPVTGSSARGFSLYLYRRSGDNYPSYWHPDGTEIVRMLDDMPISTFEEITGIFGEPRGDHSHGGIDFKAPEGTPVRTPHGGRVARMDWNSEYNGRCLELDIGGGYSEIFLHLQGIAPELQPGSSAAAGALVGWVGNTGRSYSAHLHYQIDDENGYPIDPLVFGGSRVRTLGPADLEGFAAFRAACDSMMAAR